MRTVFVVGCRSHLWWCRVARRPRFALRAVHPCQQARSLVMGRLTFSWLGFIWPMCDGAAPRVCSGSTRVASQLEPPQPLVADALKETPMVGVGEQWREIRRKHHSENAKSVGVRKYESVSVRDVMCGANGMWVGRSRWWFTCLRFSVMLGPLFVDAMSTVCSKLLHFGYLLAQSSWSCWSKGNN